MPKVDDRRRGWGIATGGNSTIAKGSKDFFRPGVWNAICDQCARKCKSDEMFKRWDNAMVCSRCIEIRNPQDFVRGIPDDSSVPWSRPSPPPTFVSGVGTTTSPAQQLGTMGNGYMINGPMIG